MKQFAIIARIPDFNRKSSYGALGLSKSIKKQAVVSAQSVNINRCINTTVKRKKHIADPELVLAKKAVTRNHKFKLLVSTKLN